MGKTKKQAAVVAAPVDITEKKKAGGKRGADKENGTKPLKKQKVSGKPIKETGEEIEMAEAEEVVNAPSKATNKASAPQKNGSDKKGKIAGLKPKPQAPGKAGKKAPKEESDDSSDSDDDEEPAKPPPKSNKTVVTKNGSKVAKQESSSDDSDDDSSEEDEAPVKPAAKPISKMQSASAAVKNGKKSIKTASSSEDESSDSDDEPKPAPAKATAKAPPKKVESSSEEDSEDSDEEKKPAQKSATAGKPNAKAPAKKVESSDDEEESSDESDEDEEPAKQVKAPAAAGKSVVKPPAKKPDSSDEDEDDSDESEEVDAKEEKLIGKAAASDDSDDSEEDDENDDDDDDDDDDEDDEEEVKTKPAKKEQAQPKTPVPSAEGGGSKTVFVKNLAWSVDEDIVQDFFKDAGEVHEVRLARNPDGQFRGFGHVEFTSAAAAKKACEKSGELLEGRDIFVDLAKERLFSPGSEGNRDFKSPRGGGFSGSGGQRSGSDATAFVRGFDKFQDEDSIRNSLTEFFDECGVQNVRIPTDRETGAIKGFAYVDFKDKDALSKAIEYSGSDLNGRSVYVEEAGGGPSSGGGGGRGRGRGDFGGGRGRGGDFGGRGGRGRGSFGDRGRGGGRGGGRRGGRGFGGGGLSGSGKKTTFGDD